jgi:2-dehydro-3-deoxyphosphogluconate aldolase/(4S)-4-hydroxy-2-oxoglutarate aldolase
MIQNNILALLRQHPLIPVVTINNLEEIDPIIGELIKKNIHCIEVTLRTNIAYEAIAEIKKRFGDIISVGVGTIVKEEQIKKVSEIGVDFIVCPGISENLAKTLISSGIPFIPGVSTPSEIILGMQFGWNTFKFFPANLFGGLPALKTYGQVFPEITFCPTGGINEKTFNEYLSLKNVISVGGSWMISK